MGRLQIETCFWLPELIDHIRVDDVEDSGVDCVDSFGVSWVPGQLGGGENSLTWHEAESWCSRRGRRMVSVDGLNANEVLGFLTRSGRPYFWTGGFKSFGDNVRWPNGNSGTPSRGSYPWGTAGLHGPQPDGGHKERCIAA